MFQVYILKSLKDGKTYTGYSDNVSRRLLEHNAGKVTATQNCRPWEILYKENVENIQKAKSRERYWKSGGGRRKLKQYFQKGFPPQP